MKYAQRDKSILFCCFCICSHFWRTNNVRVNICCGAFRVLSARCGRCR